MSVGTFQCGEKLICGLPGSESFCCGDAPASLKRMGEQSSTIFGLESSCHSSGVRYLADKRTFNPRSRISNLVSNSQSVLLPGYPTKWLRRPIEAFESGA
jgi:hypothetical protein